MFGRASLQKKNTLMCHRTSRFSSNCFALFAGGLTGDNGENQMNNEPHFCSSCADNHRGIYCTALVLWGKCLRDGFCVILNDRSAR